MADRIVSKVRFVKHDRRGHPEQTPDPDLSELLASEASKTMTDLIQCGICGKVIPDKKWASER